MYSHTDAKNHSKGFFGKLPGELDLHQKIFTFLNSKNLNVMSGVSRDFRLAKEKLFFSYEDVKAYLATTIPTILPYLEMLIKQQLLGKDINYYGIYRALEYPIAHNFIKKIIHHSQANPTQSVEINFLQWIRLF